ncbi:recombinase family protein [Streptomyces sp. MZ04]|uniref:recombinase family protein n=1 Tax=Streptomyces sp. MZ04 TaxID=2559236 RepID=UPI00107EAAAB|nr:recombinase family protein [Streptomyces sp. MZ04]TGB13302.1 recombinase family protein [Streptomyces sp. MZ04]
MQSNPKIDIYARISKAPDGSLEKTDRQIADCRAELERRGLTLGEVFQDPNLSAWKRGVRRPGWDALLKRIGGDEPPVGVMVWRLDRFMRHLNDLVTLRNLAGEGFTIATCFGEQYDFEHNWGWTVMRVTMAEEESKSNSVRTKRGIRAVRAKGKPSTGLRAFGWAAAPKEGQEPTSPDLVAMEREAIAEAARRYLQNDELNVIARDWNERGVRTSMGGTWTGVTLRQMLGRPRNAGLVEHNGQIIGTFEDEPPIGRRTYDRVMAKMAGAKRGRPVSAKRLLTGIAQCGNCDRPINSRNRSGKYYADGFERIMYYCPSARGCGKVSIAQPDADLAIKAFVIRRLADPRHAGQLAAQAEEVRKVDEEIAQVESIQRVLNRKFFDLRQITEAEYNEHDAKLMGDLKALQARVQTAAAPDPNLTAPGAQAAVRERWLRAETPERRTLLKAALGTQKLYIDPVATHWRQIKITDRLRIE